MNISDNTDTKRGSMEFSHYFPHKWTDIMTVTAVVR